MNTCEKCSSQVPEEKAFCPNCGAAMMPERERVTETPEGMGETIYDPSSAPVKLPTPPAPPPKPVKAAPAAAPSAPKRPPSKPPVKAVAPSKVAARETPAANNNRKLHLILGVSAALFALSILIVVILYIMGKI
jgi:hypothetical protein